MNKQTIGEHVAGWSTPRSRARIVSAELGQYLAELADALPRREVEGEEGFRELVDEVRQELFLARADVEDYGRGRAPRTPEGEASLAAALLRLDRVSPRVWLLVEALDRTHSEEHEGAADRALAVDGAVEALAAFLRLPAHKRHARPAGRV